MSNWETKKLVKLWKRIDFTYGFHLLEDIEHLKNIQEIIENEKNWRIVKWNKIMEGMQEAVVIIIYNIIRLYLLSDWFCLSNEMRGLQVLNLVWFMRNCVERCSFKCENFYGSSFYLDLLDLPLTLKAKSYKTIKYCSHPRRTFINLNIRKSITNSSNLIKCI